MALDVWPWLFIAGAAAAVLIGAYLLGKEVGKAQEQRRVAQILRKQR